jgi:hypothetical protein
MSVIIVVINFYLLNSCIDSKEEKTKINFSKFYSSTNHFFKDLNTEKVTFTFVEQEDVISDTTAFYNFMRKILLTSSYKIEEYIDYGKLASETYHWIYEVPDSKLSLNRKFDILMLLSFHHENNNSKDAYTAYVFNKEIKTKKFKSTNRALLIPLIGKYYEVQWMVKEIFFKKNFIVPEEYKEYFYRSGFLLSIYKNKKLSEDECNSLVFNMQSEVARKLFSKEFQLKYKNLGLKIIPFI